MRDTRILTGAEVKALAKAVRMALGPSVAELSSRLGVRAEDGIRFHAVAASCSLSRESRGVTLKDVAATLRLPQYRLKAIEKCSISEVRGEILERYARYLELDEWLNRWAAANPRLAARLNLTTARSSGSKSAPAQLAGPARYGRRT